MAAVAKPQATIKRKASKDQRDKESKRKRSWKEADASSDDEVGMVLNPRDNILPLDITT